MASNSEESNNPGEEIASSIDQKCDLFESAWRNGESPSIEKYVEGWSSPTREKLLRELLLLEMELSTPPIEIDGFTSRFPKDENIVQDCFDEIHGVQTRMGGSGTLGGPAVSIGQKIGDYELISKIGEGGMGQVFQAKHVRMKRLVALKTLPSSLANDPELKQRFEREVEAAAKFDHINIVTAFDAGESANILFLVMQYVDGDDLSTALRQQGPFSFIKTLEIAIQAAQGLRYAHERGVIHRDIKPSNLLLEKNGTVKILDMGLARIIRNVDSEEVSDLTQRGKVMGTVDYMSPEQSLDARTADHRSDIYSLGCTIFHLLTGSPVFEGDTVTQKIFAHHRNPIPAASDKKPELPPEADELLDRMLAKKPEDRFQSMQEVIDALVELKETAPEENPSDEGRNLREMPTRPRMDAITSEGESYRVPDSIVGSVEWSRNDFRRGALVTLGLLVISLTSVTLAYHPPLTSELWKLRYDALSSTYVAGLGWEIECLRAIIFLPIIILFCWWKFGREILQIAGRLPGKRFAILARVLLVVFSLGFGTFEVYRHLSVDEAARNLVVESGGDVSDQELVNTQWYPYAAYLPYSLINYMVLLPLLVIVPIAALGSDFPQLREQQQRFVKELQENRLREKQILTSFQKFEHNCQSVCARYLDFLMLLLLAIHFECWLGRFTLSEAAFKLMIGGWTLVAMFAIGCFIWLFATYTETNHVTTRGLVDCGSTECAEFRNQHNATAFLKWLFTGRLSGIAVVGLSILFIAWLLTQK